MNNSEYSSIVKTLKIIRVFSYSVDLSKCFEVEEEANLSDETGTN